MVKRRNDNQGEYSSDVSDIGSLSPKSKSARQWRNILLQPLIQVKLGLYSIILAFAFSIAVGAILYINLGNFAQVVFQLTGVEQEVTDLLKTYMTDVEWWLLLTTSVFLAANVILSVLFTHKLVGPTYAFRRHIQRLTNGDFAARTHLRKGDAFQEVANDLNNLSSVLQKRQNS